MNHYTLETTMHWNQNPYTTFFLELGQRLQTLHQLYLKQNTLKHSLHSWTPIFELFNSIQNQVSNYFIQNPVPTENFLSMPTFLNHSIAYLEGTAAMLKNMASGSLPPDKRFASNIWQTHPGYQWLQTHYQLMCKQVEYQLNQIKGIDTHTRKKLHFYTQQFLDALSPGHFITTNPDILQKTIETRGANILQGLDHFIKDLEKSRDVFQMSLTDTSAFKIGQNIATTPGKVIYQNALMQLIQYDPQTPNVYQRPLLIIPPWINKYYILDLTPQKSLVNWLVQKGYTVLIISWVNPDASYAHKQFEDYMLEGPIAALKAIQKAMGPTEVNAVGYCIGGTLLACTLSYLAQTQGTGPIASGTYLTTLLDFSEPGDLGLFMDEAYLRSIEARMEAQGFLDGASLSHLFNSLRANDLIWAYYIKHYLKGETPVPTDVLFWNSDATHLPAAAHRFYLRHMYFHNQLAQPGKIQLAGIPIHLKAIQIPVYFLSTERDHIAPWKSTYAGVGLHSGSTTFVLGGSGHVVGVINPPDQKKYHYYTLKRRYKKPETFLKNAKRHEGSWWEHWENWLKQHSGPYVPARTPEQGKLPMIEAAPGSYVKRMIDHH